MVLDAGEQKNGVEGQQDTMKKHRRQVLFSGIITAVGMSTLPICCSLLLACYLNCFRFI